MTMLCKKLLSGLLALMMLLTLVPAALAEAETRLEVTLSGMYAMKDGSYLKVPVSCDFDVYQNGQRLETLHITPEGENTITLPSGGDVSLIPVPGSYPAELPVSVYGYGLNAAEGHLNVAPIALYANAGLFSVVGDYQADYVLLDAQGAEVMAFRSDFEGGYKLEQAIPAGSYTLRMVSAAGPLWEDQQFEIVTYTGKDSIVKLRRPATKKAEATPVPDVEATAEPTAEPTLEPTATPVPTEAPTAVPTTGSLVLSVVGDEGFAVSCDIMAADGANIAKGTLAKNSKAVVPSIHQGEYIVTLHLPEKVVMTALNGNATLQRGVTQWKVSVQAMQESHYEIELTETGHILVPFENIEGAKVYVTGERESFEMTANAEGVYEKRNVLPDSYEIEVQLPAGRYDYTDNHQNWKLTENADGTCTFSMSFGVNQNSTTELPLISRIISGSASGTVVDMDGDALKGVQVTIYDENGQVAAAAQTDQNGEWAIGELNYGEYIAQYSDDERAIPATTFTLSDTNVNAQLSAAAAKPAKVKVRAFEDGNNNGSQGKNESSVRNVEVSLIDANGVVVDTGLTGRDGYVTLAAAEGEYSLRITTPEDFGFGKKGNGSKDYAQSYMEESSDRTQQSRSFNLNTGDTVEIGVGLLPLAVVTGTVWNDLNADGIWQEDEPGIPGIRLTLTGGKDKISLEVYTDENGFYDFHQVKKGTYKVTCYVPDEYVFTGKAKGELDKISRMTTEKDRAGEDQLSLKYGEVYGDHNIGMMEGAIIDGVCFLDANYNGIYDEGEQPLPGVEMRLARQSNNVMLQNVKSAEDGSYHFVGQRGSTFTIRATLPKGYVFTMVGEGGNANLFAPNGTKTERRLSDITLENGEYRQIMLGAVSYGSISGRVYYDDNFSSQWEKGEGLGKEIYVTLYHMNGERAGRVRTDNNGLFEFNSLVPGEYYMTMTPAKGYAFTALGAGNVMQTLPDGTGRSRMITVGMGEDVKDAGAGMIVPAIISGVFYADENDNGLRETGENGLIGATVRLMTENGEACSASIDESGAFRFSTVPGRYYLQYELPGEGLFPYVMEGGNAIAGENGIGKGEWFSVNMGDTWTAPLCGGVLLSDISGLAFTDSNGNAVMDADEALFAGMTITLTPSRADLSEITIVTGADGLFAMNDLRPDKYTLTVSCPNNSVLSRMKNVDMGLTNGLSTQSVTLDLKMGTQWHDQHLGCVLPSEWTGEAYLDENYNGVYDAGEAPANGETFILRDANTGEDVTTVLTDDNGVFVIEGIAPGEYELVYPLDEGNLMPKDPDIDFHVDGDVMTTGRVRIYENEDKAGTKLSIARTTEIGGTVWLEQYNGVTPVKGAKIHLLDAEGNAIAEYTTGEDGKYVFKGLMPDDYAIDATIPEGYVLVDASDLTMAEKGLISVVEEANGLFGKSAVIELKMAKHRRDMDVGMVLPGRLGDKVWLDLNGNGLQDGDEGGIPGVTVELVRNERVIASAVTDQYGYYVFEELYPTEYTLHVIWPAEVKPTILRTEIPQISSVLQENGESIPVKVESNKANYAADLGFVLVEEGKLPAGYGEGETQIWKKK